MPATEPVATRHINDAGLSIIKRFEGLRLEAYRAPEGHWAIGYGHTSPLIHYGQRITETEAEALLRADLRPAERAVAAVLAQPPLTDNQFSALCSFAYNLGATRFYTGALPPLLRAGRHAEVADRILRYNKAMVSGRLTVLAGLARRREAERALFLTP